MVTMNLLRGRPLSETGDQRFLTVYDMTGRLRGFLTLKFSRFFVGDAFRRKVGPMVDASR